MSCLTLRLNVRIEGAAQSKSALGAQKRDELIDLLRDRKHSKKDLLARPILAKLVIL